MEYKIVHSFANLRESAFEQLEEIVNSEIKQGWIPQGGISADNDARDLVQAMIKK